MAIFLERPPGHHEMDFRPVLDVFVSDNGGGQFASVDISFLDIYGVFAPALGGHLDLFPVREGNAHPGHAGRTDVVPVGSRAERIETHAVEEVPGAHLAAVVVAAEGSGLISVEITCDVTYPFLAVPGLSEIVI